MAYSAREVARLLSTSEQHIWRLIRKARDGQPGGLAAIKIGERTVIEHRDIEAYLAERRAEAAERRRGSAAA